jgi:hypothetical protein
MRCRLPRWPVTRAILLAAACTAAPDSTADPAVPAVPAAEPTPAALGEHIRVLAHDSMEGRGTGTPGYARAARYVVAQFEKLGLEPAGTDGWFQPVRLSHARTESGSVVLNGPGDARTLVRDADFIAVPDPVRPTSEVTAAMVIAGFGVTAPGLSWDDYKDVDARGKIVILVSGAPSSFPATERAHYATAREKMRNAVAHGAVGIIATRSRETTFPWDRQVRQARGGAMRWLGPDGAPADVFPGIRAIASLSDSAGAALLAGTLPGTATIGVTTRHTELASPNIAALLRGSDPRLRDEFVVITAHLDHLGVGQPVSGDSIYNGALDNASGTAALLEVARAFAAMPERPRRSILFLAVTGEEMGLLGSDYFAQHPTVPKERIVANVNIDGLSILYPFRDAVAFGSEHSTLDSVVARAAAGMGVALGPDPFPQEAFFVRSDQYSFVRQGIPSVFLFMGFKGDSGLDAAARFRGWMAGRYHTPQDDLDQPMDLEAGARHATLTWRVALEIANAERRPAWKEDSFLGRMFGQARGAE